MDFPVKILWSFSTCNSKAQNHDGSLVLLHYRSPQQGAGAESQTKTWTYQEEHGSKKKKEHLEENKPQCSLKSAELELIHFFKQIPLRSEKTIIMLLFKAYPELWVHVCVCVVHDFSTDRLWKCEWLTVNVVFCAWVNCRMNQQPHNIWGSKSKNCY